ncbi:hypothetical protein PAHAL_3G143100 [Panicum hallii]|uniref:Uncharacterized protein n=1 Tax=Panicum hallii TaxID=206008 RepID=A0A2S3H8P6_9POAL|nr:hypothetical protein PAHAL_3G143100 [Panicum hallii]
MDACIFEEVQRGERERGGEAVARQHATGSLDRNGMLLIIRVTLSMCYCLLSNKLPCCVDMSTKLGTR